MELEDWVLALPKVELHVHLDGAFDRSLLWDLAQKRLKVLPETFQSAVTGKPKALKQAIKDCRSLEDFEKLVTCKGQRSLAAMLDCFSIFLPCVKGDLEALEELSYRFCVRQAKQNIAYTEVRYCPYLFMEGEYSLGGPSEAEPVLQAVTRGLRRGCEEYGIIVNQIVCCMSFEPTWSLSIVELASRYRDAFPCAVVGVDAAGGEVGDYPVAHAAAFTRAQRLSLRVTLHAGETGPAANVWHAVYEFEAKRVGHGYAAASDEELLQDLVKRKAHFEVCPTSSNETGAWKYYAEEPPWDEHPMWSMLEAGASVSINSDDPSVFETTLIDELLLCVRQMGLSKVSRPQDLAV